MPRFKVYLLPQPTSGPISWRKTREREKGVKKIAEKHRGAWKPLVFPTKARDEAWKVDLNVAFWGLLLYNVLYRNNLRQRYRCDSMLDNKGTVVQLSWLSKQTCRKSKQDRNGAGSALTRPKELLSDWFGLMCCMILTLPLSSGIKLLPWVNAGAVWTTT